MHILLPEWLLFSFQFSLSCQIYGYGFHCDLNLFLSFPTQQSPVSHSMNCIIKTLLQDRQLTISLFKINKNLIIQIKMENDALLLHR